MRHVIVGALCFLAGAIAVSYAAPANAPGFVIASGQNYAIGACLKVGSVAGNGSVTLLPFTCPTPGTLAIGSAVAGSVPGAALTTDASGNLAQYSGLSAN